MVLKLCSRCKKRVAVIYMQRIENGNTTNEGLCLKCAREMGLKPVDDILERMGITPEEFDAMSDEISGLVPTEAGDNPENEGRAPSLNLGPLFASQGELNLPDNIRKDKQQSKETKQESKKQKELFKPPANGSAQLSSLSEAENKPPCRSSRLLSFVYLFLYFQSAFFMQRVENIIQKGGCLTAISIPEQLIQRCPQILLPYRTPQLSPA